jgi:predicted Holliday junction resolvase-like endonuclease
VSKVGLNTDIKSLLDFYREERRIYGRCPKCREPFRLSEAKLTYGKEPPRDLLSVLRKQRDNLTEQIEELEGQAEAVEWEHDSEIESINARWEGRVEAQVEQRLATKTKAIRREAIERSRVTTLGKTIERIAPMVSGFGFHPGDVRPLFEPIDYIVFDGLWSRRVNELVFVEFKTGGSALSPVQKSIREAVDRKKVRFEERRLSAETLRGITGTGRNRALIEGKKKG